MVKPGLFFVYKLTKYVVYAYFMQTLCKVVYLYKTYNLLIYR